MNEDFVTDLKSTLNELETEVSDRNEYINRRDTYIYGDQLERSLDIPIGHDQTDVNWLRRSVEIHRDQFMGRGFALTSSYDTIDLKNITDDKEKQRIQIENHAKKQRAEDRRRLVDAIIRDNGGMAIFKDLAETASAAGFAVAKTWYDKEEQKYRIVPVESVENFYALWSRDNFREVDLYAYDYQLSPTKARELYGEDVVPEDAPTSTLGQISPSVGASVATNTEGAESKQTMVTVTEITGKVPGWGSKKGNLKKVKLGRENNMNVLIVGEKVVRIIDDEKKLPRYYIFPNRRWRKRPWGRSDISDAMISLNQTYIQTLSDWRTVAHKVNFPKFKLYGFSPTAETPKFEPRKVQGIPLADGQDIVQLQMGDANQIDFNAQINEIKEQFVREAGISRVLFDDPSITLNSNQALMTSMKATTDIAEGKRALWEPVIVQMFNDALQVIGQFIPSVKDLADEEDDWNFTVKYPTTLQREDPLFQQMLLNRFNSNTISLQTFLEEQGETKEEIDRIRDEMTDPITASILSRSLGLVAQGLFSDGQPEPKVSVNLRGDLSPYQEANLASQYGFNNGPFPPTATAQGNQGQIAQENADNKGFLTGNVFQGGEPIQRGPDGQPVGAPPQVQATQAQNTEGTGPVSQPGSGAPAVSPQGALNQVAQNEGA